MTARRDAVQPTARPTAQPTAQQRAQRRAARNGLIGLTITVLLVALALNVGRLPFLGDGGREVRAEFADASGLEIGDRVEIAGVDVGVVTDLEMGRGVVVATFTVADDVRLGERTRATVKVSNLLGSKHLEVTPAGEGTVPDVIPVTATTPAYDLTTAFEELTETTEPIDTRRLEQALGAVSRTFAGSGDDVRAAVRGVSALSRAVASRDTEITRLLRSTRQLTTSLDGSREDVGVLLRDTAALLDELDRRRDAVHGLVVHTRELTVQLRGLVRDNEKQLRPMLVSLGEVADRLEQRQQDLRETIRGVALFARVFVNTIGSGPWFDSFIGNAPDSFEVEKP